MKQKSEQLRQLSTLKHDRIIHLNQNMSRIRLLEDRMLGLLLGLPPGASAPRVESTSQLRGYAGSWEPQSSRVFVELQIIPGLQRATWYTLPCHTDRFEDFKKSSKRMMRSGIRRLLSQKINVHFGSAMQCCSYAIKVHIDIALHKSRLRDAICEEDTSSLTSFIT